MQHSVFENYVRNVCRNAVPMSAQREGMFSVRDGKRSTCYPISTFNYYLNSTFNFDHGGNDRYRLGYMLSLIHIWALPMQ